ncbi:MAG: 2-amino-4-hydroxy-6-hydroxymethyldihydropteridine diphosphokinase [Desulfobacteraceae bacterium]|jgi:2-amino-4-hydroxy-6-hydroxymethyldihydropteridine diphosphokinase
MGPLKNIHSNNQIVHTAYLSIGSNMGDKLAHCDNALNTISKNGVGTIIARSPYYCTEPVDYVDQDWFLNAVVKIETFLEPLPLLTALQFIQSAAGRKISGVRFGPRTLDLDIIFYDEIILNHERLQIPHPRMHKRRFVLQPICDIDPQIVHPVLKQNIVTLLEQINDSRQRISHYPCAS